MQEKKRKTPSLKRVLSAAEQKIATLDRTVETTRSELGAKVKKEAKGEAKDASTAAKAKEQVKATKEQLRFEIRVHRLEKGDVKDALHEVDDIECAVSDAAYIIAKAQKIQKKKKK